ncbi:MAG TPA: TolC family protein [Acidobacteriota bacterium]|nr:TolC family protein [Acidobacteriota bacterium]
MLPLQSVYSSICRRRLVFFGFALAVAAATCAYPRDITLDEAIDMAVDRSARGGIIRGREEVAEQNYYARRINFLLPEISIQGNAPAYTNDESYRLFGADPEKRLYKTRDFTLNSFIELKQSVPVVGGTFVATANLARLDSRYPYTRYSADSGYFVDELSSRGFFRFSLEQQLFRPSAAKFELHNKKDDFEIARLARHEEQAALTTEVIEAYMGVLQLSIREELYSDKLESARLKADIDSMKLQDGIVSEDDFLVSASARLDAELESFEIEMQARDRQRELATLLDAGVTEALNPSEPVISGHLGGAVQQRLIAAWEQSVPIRKAELVFAKAKRSADYAAAGHGLTGDLKADYSFGRQRVEAERYDQSTQGLVTSDDDISTAGWGVTLEFKLPLWDGGAGGAAVKAARFEAEQARLEYDGERTKARADITSLANQLDVSYRRLEIMRKQIELASDKLEIARSRLADGQISRLTFLESKIFYLESRDRYLDELRKYLVNRVELEGKFTS